MLEGASISVCLLFKILCSLKRHEMIMKDLNKVFLVVLIGIFILLIFIYKIVNTILGGSVLMSLDLKYYNPHDPAFSEVSFGSASFGGISHANTRSEDPAIAVYSDGSLAVVWGQYDNNDVASIQVSYYSNGQWQTLPSPYQETGKFIVGDPAITFGLDGILYISWTIRDHIYILQWNGIEWLEVGLHSASGEGISSPQGGAQPELGIAPNGHLFVAWASWFQTQSCIYVREWDGTVWRDVGDDTTKGCGISNSQVAIEPELVVDSQGRVYVAWVDIRDEKQYTFIKQWNGAIWEVVGQGSASGTGLGSAYDPNGKSPGSRVNLGSYWESPTSFPAMAIAPNDDVYVVWPYDRERKVAVRQWDVANQVWNHLDIISNPIQKLLEPDTYHFVDIAIGPNSTPYVVWDNYLGIQALEWNGEKWQEVVEGSARANGISSANDVSTSSPAIAIGDNGVVYVAWEVTLNSNIYNTVFEIYVRKWATTSP